jgi:hypothetical protein
MCTPFNIQQYILKSFNSSFSFSPTSRRLFRTINVRFVRCTVTFGADHHYHSDIERKSSLHEGPRVVASLDVTDQMLSTSSQRDISLSFIRIFNQMELALALVVFL